MTKKIMLTTIVMSAVLALVGCGGGSDSSDSSEVGTAYYIDSAVSGVNYTCGSQKGITGIDGAFDFELGKSCTFYLGDIELRSVDKGLLIDGENVYETDVKIARILQSLDSDGDADNGITIDAATVEALAKEGITTLPKTEAEMDEMLAVIAANGGTEVSEEDASEHMLTTLLAGNTFYTVEEEGDISTLIFNENLTSMVIMNEGSELNENITVEGNRLTFNSDSDESYTLITISSDDYIMFADYYSGGSLDGPGHRLYYDKAKAEAYLKTLNSGDSVDESILAFSSENLNGKTFYGRYFENNENLHAEMKFSSTILFYTFYNANGVAVDSGSMNYTVLADGSMSLSNGDQMKKLEIQDNMWLLLCTCDDDGDGVNETEEEAKWFTEKPTDFPV